MLSILPILIYFIASTSCIPLYSTGNMFRLSCREAIQKELYINQGVNPDLNSPVEFGYIYSIESPEVKLEADLQIKQSSTSKELGDEIPRQATSVLTSISYKERDNQFTARGRISQSNAKKLKDRSMTGTEMQVKFGVFTFDKSKHAWYRSFTGGGPGGITGIVTNMRVVQQVEGNIFYPELIVELAPKARDEYAGYEYLEYAASGPSTSKQINWSASGCRQAGNKDVTFVASKRDRFNEIIESAVLL